MPGAIVHELSHALFCLVTGTTIKELNLFTSNSTGIKYDKPKIPFLFDFIIAAAPMFGCVFFIFLYQSCFPIPSTSAMNSHERFILRSKGFSIYYGICLMRYGLLFMPLRISSISQRYTIFSSYWRLSSLQSQCRLTNRTSNTSFLGLASSHSSSSFSKNSACTSNSTNGGIFA